MKRVVRARELDGGNLKLPCNESEMLTRKHGPHRTRQDRTLTVTHTHELSTRICAPSSLVIFSYKAILQAIQSLNQMHL